MTNKQFIKRLNALTAEAHELCDEVQRSNRDALCDVITARNRLNEFVFWVSCAAAAQGCRCQ